MKMLTFFVKSFIDKSGKPSATRLTVFVAFVFCLLQGCVELFTSKEGAEYIFYGFLSIVITGLGFGTFEKSKILKE